MLLAHYVTFVRVRKSCSFPLADQPPQGAQLGKQETGRTSAQLIHLTVHPQQWAAWELPFYELG